MPNVARPVDRRAKIDRQRGLRVFRSPEQLELDPLRVPAEDCEIEPVAAVADAEGERTPRPDVDSRKRARLTRGADVAVSPLTSPKPLFFWLTI